MPTSLPCRLFHWMPTHPILRQQSRLALTRLEDRCTPAVITWDGGPGGNGTDWLTGVNWVGDVLPGTADDVTIGATGTSTTISLGANASVRSITSSRAIQLTAGTLSLGAATSTFSDLTLNGGTLDPVNGTSFASTTINGPRALTVGSGETVTITGSTSVNAPLVNNGTLISQGTLTATGTYMSGAGSTLRLLANSVVTNPTMTMSGFTNNGLIDLLAPGFSAALTITSGVLTNSTGSTISNNDGNIYLFGQSVLDNRGIFTIAGDTALIRAGTSPAIPSTNSGSLSIAAGGNISIIQGVEDVFTNAGTISVASGGTLQISNGSLGNFSGNTLAGGTFIVAGTLTFPNAAISTLASDLTLSGTQSTIRNSLGGGALNNFASITSAGRLTLAGNRSLTAASGFSNDGTLIVSTNSTFTSPFGLTNAPHGTLGGGGTITANIASFGAVSPGTSPGLLTVNGNVILGGPFAAELNGTAGGSGYDRLAVNGTVSLSGTTLGATLNFAAMPGDSFIIIANDGNDAVSGTFIGLSEGSNTIIGGRPFRISYVDGTGNNDITLTAIAPAPRVSGVQVNAGQANLSQRSKVTNLAVTFSSAVTFTGGVAAAFQLSRIGDAGVGAFTANAAIVNDVTVVTLTGFNGAETEFGSLVDGRFQLVVVASQVSANGQQLDGDGNGTGGDNYTLAGTTANGLFRLFGDANGDGSVSGGDFGLFRAAFGTSAGDPAYLDYLDFDGNGSVSGTDFGNFRLRFGTTVP